jgi:hypothetical protein
MSFIPVSLSILVSSLFKRSSCTGVTQRSRGDTGSIRGARGATSLTHLAGCQEACNIYEWRVLLWQEVWPVHTLQAGSGSCASASTKVPVYVPHMTFTHGSGGDKWLPASWGAPLTRTQALNASAAMDAPPTERRRSATLSAPACLQPHCARAWMQACPRPWPCLRAGLVIKPPGMKQLHRAIALPCS